MIGRVAGSVVHGAFERLVANAIRKAILPTLVALAGGAWWLVTWLGPWWPVLPAVVGALVFRKPLWWLIKHPAWLATGIVTVCSAIQWGPHTAAVLAPATLLTCVTLWIGAVVARGTARGFAPIVLGLSRLVKTRARWEDTCQRMQPSLISRHTGQPVHASGWRITGRGLEVRLHTASLGLHSAAATGWSDNLTAVLGCDRVRVTMPHPSTAHLRIEWGQHLREHLPLHKIPQCTRPGRYVCVGITEDGLPLELPIGSLFLAAMTGMGKSSLVWTYLYDLRRQGIPHELVVIDPKRVEWSVAERHLEESPIVRAYAGSPMQWGNNGIRKDGKGWMQVNVEQVINDRLAEYAANGHRDHTPTPESPLIMVIVDETLPMAKQLRAMGESHPLAMAAFMGRAIGVIVVFLTQIAEKEVVGAIRDMIPNRACGRLLTAEQVDMALGQKASSRGAQAHLLHPLEDRGVIYYQDERGIITLGRFGYAEDEDTVDLIMGRIPAVRIKPVRDIYARRDCWIYHLFNADGELIYIGKSVDPKARFGQHKNGEHIWSPDIATMTVIDEDDPWESEAAALVEEAREIRRYAKAGHELYNIEHNPNPPRVYRPSVTAGAPDPWSIGG